jgi:hypothetical protein
MQFLGTFQELQKRKLEGRVQLSMFNIPPGDSGDFWFEKHRNGWLSALGSPEDFLKC